MHNVLLIDDNVQYAQSQVEMAANFGIALKHIDNWGEAQKELEDKPGLYKAVILDGKGKLKKQGKEEDIRHLQVAMPWFSVQKAKGHFIELVINTGFYEDIHQLYGENNIKIYGKLGQEKQMFEELKTILDNFVETKYRDVTEVFNGIVLPIARKADITELLKAYEQKIPINKPFNSIRSLLEIICKQANSIDRGLCPDELFDKTKNNKPNLKAAARYFTGQTVDLSKIGSKGELRAPKIVFPGPVGWVLNSLVETCHVYSHDQGQQQPPPYAFENALFGICEIIVGFSAFVKQYYPQK